METNRIGEGLGSVFEKICIQIINGSLNGDIQSGILCGFDESRHATGKPAAVSRGAHVPEFEINRLEARIPDLPHSWSGQGGIEDFGFRRRIEKHVTRHILHSEYLWVGR